MDFFATYYQEKFPKTQFKDFKLHKDHPDRILKMFLDTDKREKMR